MMSLRIARVVALCAAMAALAIPSLAQVSTGRIDAAIVDSTGAVLPGVTVDISGPQSHSAVTDNLGEVHFLNLAPGTYTVSAKLSGFSDYLNKNVAVSTGASVPLKISMAVAGVSTQVQVTSDAPIVDTRRMTASTNVSVTQPTAYPEPPMPRRYPRLTDRGAPPGQPRRSVSGQALRVRVSGRRRVSGSSQASTSARHVRRRGSDGLGATCEESRLVRFLAR